MTILSAMQSAAIRLVGHKPAVFFTASEKFELEIADMINLVARDICRYKDWQALTKIYEVPTDGETESFDLPSDYDRQLLVTDIQDLDNWVSGYEHVDNINEFMFRRARGFEATPGAWTIYQNKLHFFPAPALDNSAAFPYISNQYALGQESGPKSEFTDDMDSFVIRGGEEILTLGLVWRWRENKKEDYTGDQEAFILALDQIAAKDKGSQVHRSGRSAFRGLNTHIAWPFELG